MPLDSTLTQSLAVERKDVAHGAGVLRGDGGGAEELKDVDGEVLEGEEGDQEGHREVSRIGGSCSCTCYKTGLTSNILCK